MDEVKAVFMVSHLVFSKEKLLNKNSRAILIALLALQDKYLFKAGKENDRGWFNVNNNDLCDMVGISKTTLIRCRLKLIEFGWILYKRGYKGRNSEYTILIDNFV